MIYRQTSLRTVFGQALSLQQAIESLHFHITNDILRVSMLGPMRRSPIQVLTTDMLLNLNRVFPTSLHSANLYRQKPRAEPELMS